MYRCTKTLTRVNSHHVQQLPQRDGVRDLGYEGELFLLNILDQALEGLLPVRIIFALQHSLQLLLYPLGNLLVHLVSIILVSKGGQADWHRRRVRRPGRPHERRPWRSRHRRRGGRSVAAPR